jgi:putative membrane protein
MTRDDSGIRTIATVVAVLFAIPVLMMSVMVLLGLSGVGGMPGHAGGWRILLPVIPLIIFGSAVYVLYTGIGGRGEQETDRGLDELRAAYARGDLSETEFENRRERLQTHANSGPRLEGSNDE